MPSSVSILCQINSKTLDGGFVNGSAKYIVQQNKFITFRYGYYKKQISFFLHDLQINNYALICGKCVFNQCDMYVSSKSFYFIIINTINIFVYLFLYFFIK
jgi:hypothetical protein